MDATILGHPGVLGTNPASVRLQFKLKPYQIFENTECDYGV